MKRAIFLAALMVATPAFAGMKDTMIARELGQIVASSDICCFQVNSDKVAAFVAEKISAMDELSRMTYQTGLGAQKIRLTEMGETERKASCALNAKLASKYGLSP